jgi:hypothetical protein
VDSITVGCSEPNPTKTENESSKITGSRANDSPESIDFILLVSVQQERRLILELYVS